MKLLREVRCHPASSGQSGPDWGDHGAASWTCRATVNGPIDRRTGYVFDIKRIDALVHESVLPAMQEVRARGLGVAAAVQCAFSRAAGRLEEPVGLDALELSVTQFLSFTVARGSPDMVRVTRRFEFCAAHRLYCREFSDDENRRTFGACSNPNWHGHNYVLDVIVGGEPDPGTGLVIEGAVFERAVKERAIDPFDHRNLNLECDDFKGLNPSVENIARVIWRRLDGALGTAKLHCVRVWETSKTSAEYTGP